MRVSIVSFTEQGRRLAARAGEVLCDVAQVALYEKPKEGVVRWAGEQFASKSAIVFVGACGIAVRAIAPSVKDKLEDVPVLVVDEAGRFVIPILSGHVGGANELAVLLAERLGAEAVVTTATDIRGKFAVDVFAKKNGLNIENKDGIAKVSAKVLRGEQVTLSMEGVTVVPYPPEGKTDIVVSTDEEVLGHAVLRLRPKEYVLGIGCKRGKTREELDLVIQKKLTELGIAISDIAAIASIDLKKEEPGITAWADFNRIPFLTYTAEQLQGVPGDFQGSAFVEQTVGVDNVCERAALLACGAGGVLVCGKYAKNGVTVALARRDWREEMTWGEA